MYTFNLVELSVMVFDEGGKKNTGGLQWGETVYSAIYRQRREQRRFYICSESFCIQTEQSVGVFWYL